MTEGAHLPLIVGDPRHWRESAQEARTIASAISDAPAKATMLEVAAGYERLAERAETRDPALVKPGRTA